ncbi:hypothetical protein Pint_03071 [Pistacia integerrima]|uniref:Uncharacterized protein n=1 Tax=Pistacia integerrima TaxID=434235 RepID=A0ACC0ZL24_9ROSI|nr:hypothetical protein Pint_03071 [Pistacia integerrima]
MTTIAASVAALLPVFRSIRRHVAVKTTSCLAEIRRLEMRNVQGTRKRLKDYFEESKDLIKSDGGPPRWFSPLECVPALRVLLSSSFCLSFFYCSYRSLFEITVFNCEGIDGVGLGLIKHHHMLGNQVDLSDMIICLLCLVELVEETVRSESHHSPARPIYLFGESLGACIALAVASRNPAADLVLILANPTEKFIYPDFC